MFDVVGIGRNCIDHLALLRAMPRTDTKAPMLRYRNVGGGQTATALVALATLGLKVAYIGRVGGDTGGRTVIEGLKRAGVDTSGVIVEEKAVTPVALILVEEKTGRRTIAYTEGRKGRIPKSKLNLKMILSARCLMIDPQETLTGLSVAAAAKKAGIPVIYDAEHRVEGFERMLSVCDYVVASEEVVEVMGAGSPEEALEKLYASGPQAAVITLGERGSIARGPAGVVRRPAFKVEVVDTTAAGDAFHAGFAYSVLKGWELARTLEFSNAMGALVCRGLGGRETLPTIDELRKLLGWPAEIFRD